MRSASSDSEAACDSVVGTLGRPCTVALLAEVAASVTSEALVPNSQSRRGIRFGPMASASKKSCIHFLNYVPQASLAINQADAYSATATYFSSLKIFSIRSHFSPDLAPGSGC